MLPNMEKSSFPPTTHTLAIFLMPNQYLLIPASGWAIIAGLLTVRPWILEGDLWQNNAGWVLKALLLWLLFDPILGTIWQLLINHQLRQQTVDGDNIVLHGTPSLPYVTRNSAAYRWLLFRQKIRQQSRAEWQSLFLLSGLALGLGATFGWEILLAVALSLGIMWRISGTIAEKTLVEQVWQMLLQFIFPFGTAIVIFGTLTLPVSLFGIAFALIFDGTLRLKSAPKWGERWLIFGLSATAILLFALRLPMAGAVTVLSVGTVILLRQDIAAAKYRWDEKIPSLNAILWLTLLISAWFMGELMG